MLETKVLFVYPNVGETLQTCQGIASMSGYLKEKRGIDVQLWDCTFEDSMISYRIYLQEYNPDFICFTALSPDYRRVKTMAEIAKLNCNAEILIGGPHATFLPYEVIAEDCFDVVFIGEAEYSLYSYITNHWEKTPGTYVKRNRTISINPVDILPMVETLPFPDHKMFSRHFKKAATWSGHEGNYAAFITARGCPFKCSYCYAKGMADIYKGQKYTRYKKVDDVIAEVGWVKDTYGLSALYFIDETFTTNKERVYELCDKYKKEIGLPWHCETRPNTVDQDILNAMADAGCEVVMMGIESGSDRIRNEIYNRNLSEKQIVDAFEMAHKAGIKTSAFNIIGAPTETYGEALSTIELNRRCNVDYGKMTTFNLFPGSELWKTCKEEGYFISDIYPKNYYVDSNIITEPMTPEAIQRIRKMYVRSIGGYTGSTVEGQI
jgi:anaerobic magnesium-protoporphyrin IX monomethyl ester cyclase